MAKWLVKFAVLTAVWTCRAQQAPPNQAVTIGAVNYFGYEGLPLEKIRAAVAFHAGGLLDLTENPRPQIDAAVLSQIGRRVTDVDVVCCDAEQRIFIFIGLPGSSSRKLSLRPAPQGEVVLPGPGLALYRSELNALSDAVSRGASAEDDSLGYMIGKDPALRAINLAERSYAVDREAEITRILRNAADAEQRRAAATLLGYVRHSRTQADALSEAMKDVDSEVRNNATRSLEVLASTAETTAQLPTGSVIDLLYSGVWSDRNKASLLLLRLTDSNNASLLRELREKALTPLIEGARWSGDPGHSDAFLFLLGRLARLDKTKLTQMVSRHDVEEIIAAARRSPTQ